MADDGSKTQISLRFPDDLLLRVDDYRQRVMASLPGHEFTRADAIRVLVVKGLEQAIPNDSGAASPPRSKGRRRA